jgi:hypothetical protein
MYVEVAPSSTSVGRLLECRHRSRHIVVLHTLYYATEKQSYVSSPCSSETNRKDAKGGKFSAGQRKGAVTASTLMTAACELYVEHGYVQAYNSSLRQSYYSNL